MNIITYIHIHHQGVPPLAGDVAALQKTMNNIILGTRIDAQLAKDVADGMSGVDDDSAAHILKSPLHSDFT
jgi:hypothetical protein